MSAPIVKNLANRQREGYKTFSQWFDDENNVYIGRNAGKYAKRSGLEDSKWLTPFICTKWDVAKEQWVSDLLNECYEKYVRNSELIDSLNELEGKILGCWCAKQQQCHGDVLVKLYNEHYSNQSRVKNGEPIEKRKRN